MRALKLVCPIVLACSLLIGVSVIITSGSVHAAPLAAIVPVTTTIQAAIDIAQAGDTIVIPVGTYTESLTVDKNITLTGVTSAATIIHAVSNQRVITVTTGHDLLVVNLAVVGGRAGSAEGGGIRIENGHLQLINVVVADNWGTYGGGIFQGGAGRVDAINSRIERNQASIDGGGLYINGDVALTDTSVLSNTASRDGGGLNVWNGRADVVRGSFGGNQALGRNGGGININNSLGISGTLFFSNTAKQDGGGVLQWNSNQIVTVTNARFERNVVIGNGGGLAIAQGTTTTVTGTLFLSNRADSYQTTETDVLGGGLYFSGTGLLRIDTSTFSANYAFCSICSRSDGGGAYIYATTAAIVQDSLFESNNAYVGGGLNSFGRVTIQHSVFRNNQGRFGGGVSYGFNISGGGGSGAKLVVQDADFLRNQAPRLGGGLFAQGEVEIAQSRFISNTGGSGTGGLHLTSATAHLTNTVIAQNRVTMGGGLYVNGTTLHAQHTTVASNTTTSGDSTGVYVTTGVPGSKVWLTNTILVSHAIGISVSLGNTATLNSTLWFGNQTDSVGNVSIANNTSGNPFLAADGYHLTAASQNAIDHGVNSGVPIDIDGDPRPIGAGYDLGADEYYPHVYLPIILR